MGKPTAKPIAKELIDALWHGTRPSAPLELADRVALVLALPRPELGGHPIAIAGWNACYADVLRLLNGEAKP